MAEDALGSVHDHAVLVESCKDASQVFEMLDFVLGGDENIVDIYEDPRDVP